MMASLKHQEDTKQLLEVLNYLLNTEDKTAIAGKVFDYKTGYVIHLIPTNFQHPLKDIVNSVKRQFFLVSKLPNIEKDLNSSDSSDDEKQEVKASLKLQELPVLTKQYVFVGTPISQQVCHLFWQKNFHDSEAEFIENSLDISNLLKLELKDARYIASLYVQCVKQRKELPEMWLLCDRGSPQAIDYIGVKPCVTDPKRPQEVSTVVVRSEEYNEKKDGFTLSDKKKQHMIFHRVNQAETRAYARYNLYGTLESYGRDANEPQSGITIEFAWDGVREILQSPPSSSNAVLKIYANPEDVQAILPGISNELNMLGSLFAMVQKKIKEESSGDKQQGGLEEEFDRPELNKNVLEFLDKLRLQSMGQPKEAESVSTSPSAAISFGAAEGLNRQDLDNTESLWVFLKELPSTEQMIFCLEVILQQLFLGEYQPVLYANNQTQIATLMKEVISCSNEKERAQVKAKVDNILITPAAALQGIVDIGIDKLQNDYINYFIKQELVTKDLLEYFTTKGVSSSEKLQRLLKLHCILSLVTLAISYARISYEDLRQLIPAALRFYEHHSYTDIPVFALSLPAFSASSSNIKNTCVRHFQPQTWVAAITTTDQFITIVQLDAKDQIESFVEGNNTFRGNSYSIATANVHKVCI